MVVSRGRESVESKPPTLTEQIEGMAGYWVARGAFAEETPLFVDIQDPGGKTRIGSRPAALALTERIQRGDKAAPTHPGPRTRSARGAPGPGPTPRSGGRKTTGGLPTGTETGQSD